MADTITFPATVYKVQTLSDNGLRVTIDMPEDCIAQMALLAECQRNGYELTITAQRADGLPVLQD